MTGRWVAIALACVSVGLRVVPAAGEPDETTQNALAAPTVQTITGGPARASLLELYTSEGCANCPPAESWLSHLAQSGQLWTDVVPVAFHVDYWDHLGWRDIFA